MADYILDNFVQVTAGQAYRLFPFGALYKNGKRRDITPEFAAQFKLPHFRPPIKLGSHNDTTPAGGQIVALEVRDDGLYAIPEFTEQGAAALERGDFRYHSPEVLWQDSAIENPATGEMITGPLIIGDALLHTPHLGEAAALYTFEPQNGELMTEQVTIPSPLWDRFVAWLDKLASPPQPNEPPQIPEQYAIAVQERDNYKAELDALKAEAAHKTLLGELVVELQNKEKYGSMYVELKAAQEAAGMMGGMTPEQREWCMRNFSALAAQAQHPELYTEQGTSNPAPTDQSELLKAAVEARQKADRTDFATAYEAVKRDQPDLFK